MLAQSRGDVAQVQARIQGLENSLRLYEQEAAIANQLAAEQLIGQLEVIDKQRALEQVRADLAAARQSLVSNRAKVEQAQAKLMETQGAFRRRASDELAQTERERELLFIGGEFDVGTMWGYEAIARAQERMPNYRGTHMLAGCGHWIQQERPAQTNRLLIDFLQSLT